MFCTKCGKILEEDAKFCQYCGKRISNANNESDIKIDKIHNENEHRTKEKIKKEQAQKIEICVIIAYIPAILGICIPYLSVVGIILFAYGIWHAKHYNKKGTQLGIIGLIIAILTCITGYYVIHILMPLINGAVIVINTAADVTEGFKDIANSAENVLDSIGGMTNSFDDLIQFVRQILGE